MQRHLTNNNGEASVRHGFSFLQKYFDGKLKNLGGMYTIGQNYIGALLSELPIPRYESARKVHHLKEIPLKVLVQIVLSPFLISR